MSNTTQEEQVPWKWLIENVHVQNISDIIDESHEQVEGNLICDKRARNWNVKRTGNKIKNLQYLCKNKKKIVEIGVNGCHSLLLMLLVNPDAEYLLFDLNCHQYTVPTINYIKSAFPNAKINVIFGNSVETIKNYIVENPNELNSYDLFHLDGGHTEDIFSHDYHHSKLLLNKENGIVIFDDYQIPAINSFIHKKVSENEIIEYMDDNIIKDEPYLHFIYKYNTHR